MKKKQTITTAPASFPLQTALFLNNLYLRDTALAKKYDVTRVTIWRWVKDGTLPAPVKLSPGCSRFYGPDIAAWEAARQSEA